ncbi:MULTISPECIES: TetR/AcrR family transcriptional regulator [Cyanophyceae]|uniref:TetR/AcrR family transcriptional regulator n=1 Tax=Cyanophyceae TaxID=3028117 RepID=UPI001683C087|nr:MULTISPECIES: TetR/AcrR family transcriptional regulator [Cyanophyceae]MBD1918339.1 TetR/AcrR family transcriptional regulator [Phormidium sp. FACHB-77]MBD2028792.1 TetR/AcrR family transcriptional regulator [Phormidium sp. FACHB-322]MBD2051213.1 TetR/AcrR family transcriptional regulator [Leptolyngbya sp. FACHB-60]
MPRTQTDAQQRILAIADDLFYREGIRAIGVDTIIAKSEVAKTTLYRYFSSKDDLVVAYLEGRNQQFWELFEVVVGQHSGQPKQQLLAIFAWLDELLSSTDSHGCPFLMIASEFPEINYPGHQVAIAHKQKMCDRMAELAEWAGIKPAKELSAALLMLVDGAFAERRLFKKHNNGVSLGKAAAVMIEAYLTKLNASVETQYNHSGAAD